MPSPRTKAVAEIEARMQQVPKGSYRYEVLTKALDFKHAWFELGSHLTKVQGAALFQEWGYPDFETYCQRELHIKKATAHKLTATYAFVERHEPDMVQSAHADPEARAALPQFDVFNVLARAEERGQIGEPEYKQVRERILDAEPPSPASLTRFINKEWPVSPANDAAEAEASPEANLKRLARSARKLADEAARSAAITPAIRDRAEALADDFESLLREAAA